MKLKHNTINFNVADITALEAITGMEENDVCVVTDENRGGTFVYRSAESATNNGGTIFDGWCRQYDGAVNVKWFGAVGDGVSDDIEAFKKVISSDFYARSVYIPKGTYYLTETLNLKKSIRLFGDSGTQSSGYISILQFADDINGILIHRYNTNADSSGLNKYIESPTTTGADGTIIENLYIRRGGGSDTITNTLYHGVRFIARGLIRNCLISGFAGAGIYSNSTSGGSSDSEGNANNWHVENTRIQNCYHGIHVDNADVNAGVGIHLDCSSNRGVGIFDSSFLGCQWIGCHCNGNGTDGDSGLDYDILHDNSNARSVFVGCYIESGGSASLTAPSMRVGGDWAGVTSEGTFYKIEDGDISNFTNLSSRYIKPTLETGEYIWGHVKNTASHSSTRIQRLIFEVGAEGSSQIEGALSCRPSSSVLGYDGKISLDTYRTDTDVYESGVEVNGRFNTVSPGTDNTWSLGDALSRWSEVYSASGTINTSDDREKKYLSIEEKETLVAKELKSLVKKFKFNNAIETKGEDNARIHFGTSAQSVIAVFESHGLNAMDYAMVCYDEWEEERDEEGNVIQEAGNRYGIRYEELIMFILGAM